jgi:hypothetical protein
MIPLNKNHPILDRSTRTAVPLQILGKGLQRLISEISSEHGCHGLGFPTFSLMSDSDDVVRFELGLRFRPFPFLVTGTAGIRPLALWADVACFG